MAQRRRRASGATPAATVHAPAGRRKTRVERLLFRFMGPPQLGNLNDPPHPGAPVEDDCPICHRPYAEHARSSSPQGTYTTCD